MERNKGLILWNRRIKGMHIIYLTNEFVTEKKPYAGLATYLDNITTIMKSKGHKVSIIILSEEDREFYYKNAIKVICVKAKKNNASSSDLERVMIVLKNCWRIYCELKKLNKKEKIDIVQAASGQAVGFFRSYKIPTVVRASSDNAFLRNAALPDFSYDKAMVEKNWEDKMELYCIKHADGVFVPSRCCARILKKRSGRTLNVIESPYQHQDIQMDYSVYEKLLKDKKYLLFNSSLSLLKGTHLGIRATEQIMEKYPELYMVYAGIDHGFRGSKRSIADILKEQNRKYQGRVIYLNKLSHEQLFPVVEHALACVLPSRIDNLPNSCIEAMAYEKVVIGTYGASFEQLIKNKDNGLLIQRDSVKALIRAVDYLMNLTDKERIAMGKKAKETIRRLAPDEIYDQLIRYYENIIEEFNSKTYLERLFK